MSSKKGKVQRNFYYYDIYLMKHINDNLTKIGNQEEIFYEIFEHILKIQKKIEKGALDPDEIAVSIDNGDKIYILVDKNVRGCPIEFRLVLCRADALPLVENNGLLNFLADYLPKNFTLAEITHCVIFPQYNIMGAEYNFSGARPTAIKPYLPRLYNKIDYVYCANKLDGNVFSKLKNGETFSLFSLSVKNDSAAMTHLMSTAKAAADRHDARVRIAKADKSFSSIADLLKTRIASTPSATLETFLPAGTDMPFFDL